MHHMPQAHAAQRFVWPGGKFLQRHCEWVRLDSRTLHQQTLLRSEVRSIFRNHTYPILEMSSFVKLWEAGYLRFHKTWYCASHLLTLSLVTSFSFSRYCFLAKPRLTRACVPLFFAAHIFGAPPSLPPGQAQLCCWCAAAAIRGGPLQHASCHATQKWQGCCTWGVECRRSCGQR